MEALKSRPGVGRGGAGQVFGGFIQSSHPKSSEHEVSALHGYALDAILASLTLNPKP